MLEENFKFKVLLNTINAVKEFNYKATLCQSDFDVRSDDNHYIIDGKSLIGIFSLDLIKPVYVVFSDVEAGKEFMKEVDKYVVE